MAKANIGTILKQSFNMTITWFFGAFISFISSIIYTHYLTPAEFGNFTLSRTVITLLGVFCMVGLNNGFLRQGSIALGKKQNLAFEQIKNYSLSYSMVIGLISCAVVFIGANFIAVNLFKNPALTTHLRYFSFIIPMMITINMSQVVFQVYHRADKGQLLYNVIYFSILIVVFYLLTFFIKSETLIITSFLAGNIIYFIILLYYQRKFGYKFSFQIDKKEKKDLFNISLPMFLAAVFQQSQKWGDTFFLGVLGSSTDVGIYYIGLRIAMFVSIPANAFNKIFMPVAGRLIGKGDQAELNDLYKIVTRLIFVSCSLFFGVIFFMKGYMLQWFGKDYTSSAPVIFVILISETIDFGVGAARQLITMSGGGKINLINSILTLITKVVSSYLLIPKYGIMGAAYANALSNAFMNLVSVAELMVIYKLSPFNKKYFLIILVFIACMAGVNSLPLQDIPKIILFLIVIIPIYLLIAVSKDEKNKFKSLMSLKSLGKKRQNRAAKISASVAETDDKS